MFDINYIIFKKYIIKKYLKAKFCEEKYIVFLGIFKNIIYMKISNFINYSTNSIECIYKKKSKVFK